MRDKEICKIVLDARTVDVFVLEGKENNKTIKVMSRRQRRPVVSTHCTVYRTPMEAEKTDGDTRREKVEK